MAKKATVTVRQTGSATRRKPDQRNTCRFGPWPHRQAAYIRRYTERPRHDCQGLSHGENCRRVVFHSVE